MSDFTLILLTMLVLQTLKAGKYSSTNTASDYLRAQIQHNEQRCCDVENENSILNCCRANFSESCCQGIDLFSFKGKTPKEIESVKSHLLSMDIDVNLSEDPHATGKSVRRKKRTLRKSKSRNARRQKKTRKPKKSRRYSQIKRNRTRPKSAGSVTKINLNLSIEHKSGSFETEFPADSFSGEFAQDGSFEDDAGDSGNEEFDEKDSKLNRVRTVGKQVEKKNCCKMENEGNEDIFEEEREDFPAEVDDNFEGEESQYQENKTLARDSNLENLERPRRVTRSRRVERGVDGRDGQDGRRVSRVKRMASKKRRRTNQKPKKLRKSRKPRRNYRKAQRRETPIAVDTDNDGKEDLFGNQIDFDEVEQYEDSFGDSTTDRFDDGNTKGFETESKFNSISRSNERKTRRIKLLGSSRY